MQIFYIIKSKANLLLLNNKTIFHSRFKKTMMQFKIIHMNYKKGKKLIN